MTNIEALRYDEAIELPKFKASLDRLLNRKEFNFILTAHHLERTELLPFIDRAITEGSAVLIEKEFCGYYVTVWKD
jgi:hypothetical protein